MRGVDRPVGLDSEFFDAKHGGKTICLTVSNGDRENKIFWSAQEFADWLDEHPDLRVMFVWNLAPEYGSLQDWGFECWFKTGPHINKARFRHEKRSILLFDMMGFFKTMNPELASLGEASKFLEKFYHANLEKLDRPDYIGTRLPTEFERPDFIEYAIQDAKATSFAASYVIEELWVSALQIPKAGYDPGFLGRIHSFGTIAAKFFDLPKVGWWLKAADPQRRQGITIGMPPPNRKIQPAIFAGRNEAFITGHFPHHNWYCDLQKQYAGACAKTGALLISRLRPLSRTELNGITSPKDVIPYGWLFGKFRTKNEWWGLPIRENGRNHYVVGEHQGWYHTLDLIASKAEIVGGLEEGYVPLFNNTNNKFVPVHQKFASTLDKVVNGGVEDEVEKLGFKAPLNATTGRLGLHIPDESIQTNYPALDTIYAQAHLWMSGIIDATVERGIMPLYMDTDSLFVDKSIAGKVADFSDFTGEYSYPLMMDVKGESEWLRVVRNKMYYQLYDEDDRKRRWIGRSAWQFSTKEFVDIITKTPVEYTVKKQVRATFRTKNKKAKKMIVGRWDDTEPLKLGLPQLSDYFRSDMKRCRPSYDSYSLMRKGRFEPSRAWTVDELHALNEDVLIDSKGQRHNKPLC